MDAGGSTRLLFPASQPTTVDLSVKGEFFTKSHQTLVVLTQGHVLNLYRYDRNEVKECLRQRLFVRVMALGVLPGRAGLDALVVLTGSMKILVLERGNRGGLVVRVLRDLAIECAVRREGKPLLRVEPRLRAVVACVYHGWLQVYYPDVDKLHTIVVPNRHVIDLQIAVQDRRQKPKDVPEDTFEVHVVYDHGRSRLAAAWLISKSNHRLAPGRWGEVEVHPRCAMIVPIDMAGAVVLAPGVVEMVGEGNRVNPCDQQVLPNIPWSAWDVVTEGRNWLVGDELGNVFHLHTYYADSQRKMTKKCQIKYVGKVEGAVEALVYLGKRRFFIGCCNAGSEVAVYHNAAMKVVHEFGSEGMVVDYSFTDQRDEEKSLLAVYMQADKTVVSQYGSNGSLVKKRRFFGDVSTLVTGTSTGGLAVASVVDDLRSRSQIQQPAAPEKKSIMLNPKGKITIFASARGSQSSSSPLKFRLRPRESTLALSWDDSRGLFLVGTHIDGCLGDEEAEDRTRGRLLLLEHDQDGQRVLVASAFESTMGSIGACVATPGYVVASWDDQLVILTESGAATWHPQDIMNAPGTVTKISSLQPDHFYVITDSGACLVRIGKHAESGKYYFIHDGEDRQEHMLFTGCPGMAPCFLACDMTGNVLLYKKHVRHIPKRPYPMLSQPEFDLTVVATFNVGGNVTQMINDWFPLQDIPETWPLILEASLVQEHGVFWVITIVPRPEDAEICHALQEQLRIYTTAGPIEHLSFREDPKYSKYRHRDHVIIDGELLSLFSLLDSTSQDAVVDDVCSDSGSMLSVSEMKAKIEVLVGFLGSHNTRRVSDPTDRR